MDRVGGAVRVEARAELSGGDALTDSIAQGLAGALQRNLDGTASRHVEEQRRIQLEERAQHGPFGGVRNGAGDRPAQGLDDALRLRQIILEAHGVVPLRKRPRQDSLEHLLFALEVVVDMRLRNPGAGGDLLHRGARETCGGEQARGGIENALTASLRTGAARRLGLRGRHFHHAYYTNYTD